MGRKPQYVVRIDDGYYSPEHAWKTVEVGAALRMEHKQARATRHRLKHLGYAAVVEPAPLSLATDGPSPGDPT